MEILTGDGNPALRAPSAPIPPDELRKYKKFAAKMVDYVTEPRNGSCGLAAPQAGKNVRLVAVTLLRTWDDEDAPTVAMFNPEILERSAETCTEKEGCLSLPGEAGLVTRSRSIRLRWTDVSGTTRERAFCDVAARIVQHEVDHLDGVLFMDKAVPLPPEEA